MTLYASLCFLNSLFFRISLCTTGDSFWPFDAFYIRIKPGSNCSFTASVAVRRKILHEKIYRQGGSLCRKSSIHHWLCWSADDPGLFSQHDFYICFFLWCQLLCNLFWCTNHICQFHLFSDKYRIKTASEFKNKIHGFQTFRFIPTIRFRQMCSCCNILFIIFFLTVNSCRIHFPLQFPCQKQWK